MQGILQGTMQSVSISSSGSSLSPPARSQSHFLPATIQTTPSTEQRHTAMRATPPGATPASVPHGSRQAATGQSMRKGNEEATENTSFTQKINMTETLSCSLILLCCVCLVKTRTRTLPEGRAEGKQQNRPRFRSKIHSRENKGKRPQLQYKFSNSFTLLPLRL